LTLDQALKNHGAALVERLPQGSVTAILNVNAPTVNLSGYIIDELTSSITTDGRLVVVDWQNIQVSLNSRCPGMSVMKPPNA
jgi:hypothetical protein